ncbi:MAG TPA: PAS domain S-box protein [Bacillota bacterium]|nr:PAS domain S-box protein [Bacillota bacterium]
MTEDAAKMFQGEAKNCYLHFNYIIEGFALFEEIRDERGLLMDLRLLQINPTFETLGELEVQALLGRTVREVYPDIAGNWFPDYDQVLGNGSPSRYELYSAQTDRWYNLYTYVPQPGQIAAFIHEVTEQKRIEKALQKSEEKYRQLVELAQEGIWVIDQNEITTFVNPCLARMLGYSVAEMLGKHLFDFMDEQGIAICKKNVELRKNGVAEALDFELIRKDGTRLYTLMSVTPRYNDKGEYVEAIATVTDITERRLMEDALKGSEEKFRTIFESSSVGITLIGLDGVVQDCNQVNAKMLGFTSKEELIGKDCFTFIATADHPKAREAWHRGLNGGSVKNLELMLERNDQTQIYGLLSARLFRNNEGMPYGMVLTTSDITEQKKGEEALWESRERFRKLFYQSPIGIGLYNSEGQLIDINQSCLEMLCITDKELFLGRKLFNTPYIPPDAKAKLLNGEIVRFETTVDFEQLRTRDMFPTTRGGYGDFYLIMSAIKTGKSLNGYLVLIEDFTERNRTKAELVESQSILETVVASMNDGLVIVDLNGNYLHVNDAFARLCKFGSKAEYFKNNSELTDLLEGYTLDGRPIGLEDAPTNRALRGEALMNYELVLKRKDTKETWVANYSFSPVRDQNGNIIAAVATARDTTLQKKFENALREADRRKDEFLAVLSHELRNPLAAIQNSLHILDHAAPAGDQANRAKRVIQRQAGQLSRLVDDLLDITRITQNKINLKRRRLEVNELVRQTIEDHQLLFEKKGVRLEAKYSQSLLLINADEVRLGQVVGNLLQNAAKFTNHGGYTRVFISSDESHRAVIRIADSGIGMTPELLSRLFQPFMQANMDPDRIHDGLGLGLALSKGLIEMHDGSITANSAGLGQGSEFVIYLPLQETSPLETEGVEPMSCALPMETQPSCRRVLIIDDNIDLAESLHELLELCEHEVAVAYNGFEGLIKAREFQPEVVLCDIGLPGMDGYEVAKAFREDEFLKNIFLVALTGYVQPKDLQKALEAGFDQHLAKPVDLDELERVLAGSSDRK